MRLVLGVLDIRYSDANAAGGSTTTGDVAEALEERYQVMRTFAIRRSEKIGSMLADSMANAILDLANGKPVDTAAPTFEGEQQIEAEFRSFIYGNEMAISYAAQTGGEALTKAAAAGVNSRKKRPYSKKNKPRPAFVDTGLYVSSFRAWVEK